MRIFCAVRHSNNPEKFYGGLWSANFYPALRELGHEIIESQVDLLPTSRFMSVSDKFTREELEVRARTTQQILEEVHAALRQGPLDLFLSYFYNAHFDPAGFDDLRRLGVPSVNFYCNSIYQFALVATIARKADYSWYPERDARNSYLAVGANPVWVQMGADPKVYFPIPERTREPTSVFVGQRYADRDRWIASIIRAGIPIDIFGPGWGADCAARPITAERKEYDSAVYLGRSCTLPGTMASYIAAGASALRESGYSSGAARILKQLFYRRKSLQLMPLFRRHAKGPVPFTKIAEVFSRYEVCLNFSNVWEDGRSGSRLIPHVRLRDFEGPMCRTCYLTGHTEEIAGFYEVGREVDTYRTEDELVEKTRFYLAHSDAAERLREAGYRRALRDHTWKCRFEELFRKLSLSA